MAKKKTETKPTEKVEVREVIDDVKPGSNVEQPGNPHKPGSNVENL